MSPAGEVFWRNAKQFILYRWAVAMQICHLVAARVDVEFVWMRLVQHSSFFEWFEGAQVNFVGIGRGLER